MISDTYKAEQQRMHRDLPNYGVASVEFAPKVSNLINNLGIRKILDYGAGKGRLGQSLELNHPATVTLYDPGIPGIDDAPEPHEMVCCIDVLEHIEPEYLDSVLDDLKRVTQRIGFFTIHTGPAMKVLSDGRNAHLIQKGPEWWLPKIMERFELHAYNRVSNSGFLVIVCPLQPMPD
jgi:2-polyprenyl-3-methyl-5-hydroxy-6-metoxy-1,4-benzoquinol methylase